MNKSTIAGIWTGIGVAMGAFGAHYLAGQLTPAQLETYRTATLYHLVHGAAATFAALLAPSVPRAKSAERASFLFLLGTIFFCGSLYGLALGGPRWLGAVAPLGGLCFIMGWLSLALAGKLAK